MYGLFERTYDYYEWDKLICISDSFEKLKNHYNCNKKYYRYELKPESAHDILAKKEIDHFAIVELTVI